MNIVLLSKKAWAKTLAFFKGDSDLDLYALIKDKTVQEFVRWDGDYNNYAYPADVSLLLVHTDLLDLKVGSMWDGTKWVHPNKG